MRVICLTAAAMARGGRFEGGGLLSMIGNLANSVLSRDMGKRSAYFAKNLCADLCLCRIMQ